MGCVVAAVALVAAGCAGEQRGDSAVSAPRPVAPLGRVVSCSDLAGDARVDDPSGRPEGAGDLQQLEVSTDGTTLRVYARADGLGGGSWKLTVAARDGVAIGAVQLVSEGFGFAGSTLGSVAPDDVPDWPPENAVDIDVGADSVTADIPVEQLPAAIDTAELAGVLSWRPDVDPDDADELLSNFLERQSYDSCPEQPHNRALVEIALMGEHPDMVGFDELEIRPPAARSTTSVPPSTSSAPPPSTAPAPGPPPIPMAEVDVAAALLDAWNAADPAAAATVAADDAVRFMFSEPTNRDAALVRCRHFSEVPEGEYQAFATIVCDGTFSADGLGEQTVELYLDGGASAGYEVTAVSFNRNPPAWRPVD
jgi:hypothetical protein